jgi:hypothetical protein
MQRRSPKQLVKRTASVVVQFLNQGTFVGVMRPLVNK